MTRQVRFSRIVVLALASSGVLATALGHAAQQAPVFSSRVQGVLVDVLVTEGNKPVAGLTVKDFELRDNGVVQTIDAVESSDVPINAVLAFDVSASTAGPRLADLVTASRELLDGLKPGDRAALTTFSHAVIPRVPLTPDIPRVRSTLDRLSPSGETAVADGVYVALMATQAETGRSLLVVYTDGRDTASWLQRDELLESAKRSNAVIYAVASGGARRWPLLKDLADATGGQTMEIASSKDLKSQFQRILQEFRSRYVLTFTPRGVPDGGFHRLDVRARRGNVKGRPGYIGAGSGTGDR